MKEPIHFSLLADSLSIEGLSVVNGKLQLSLRAEVELSALQEELRVEISRITDRALVNKAIGAEKSRILSENSEADTPNIQSSFPENTSITTYNMPSSLTLSDPGIYVTPHEHFFPEADDDNLLAEEDEALGIERDEFPIMPGSLFSSDDLPAPVLPHYFPEPPDEFAELPEEGIPTDPLAEYDELTADEEYEHFQEEQQESPAAPVSDYNVRGNSAEKDERPEEFLLAGAATGEDIGDGVESGQDLDEKLITPDARYGEPTADIEWSALLSDQHSEQASLTRPAETSAQDAASNLSLASTEEQPEDETEELEEWDEPDESVYEECEDEGGSERLANDTAFPDSEDENLERADAPSSNKLEEEANEEAEEEAKDSTPIVSPRSPLTLINPKLHNEGDAPDDTPPGGEDEAPRLQNPVFFPQAQTQNSLPPSSAERKTRIKYVCPKCHTPGQQDIDRLGSVVTCSNCGRAMRLTMKK